MNDLVLTTYLLNVVAGSILSLLIEYFPGFSGWFDTLDTLEKKQMTGIFLVISSVLIFIGSCFSPFISVSCSVNGGWEVVTILVVALLAQIQGSQTIHKLTKKTN